MANKRSEAAGKESRREVRRSRGMINATTFALRMDRFGSTEKRFGRAKLLKGLVGAWGFEPQTPTVSIL